MKHMEILQHMLYHSEVKIRYSASVDQITDSILVYLMPKDAAK